jgi:hypothetical protein
MRRKPTCIGIFLAAALASSVAHADSSGAEAPSDSAPPARWYGAPLVLTDAAAFVLIGTGIAGREGLTLMGATLYGLDGFAVHAANGEPGKGFGSLGLRLGSPCVGAATGALIGLAASNGCQGDWCGVEGLVAGSLLGFGAGMVAASIIDISVLAYKRPSSPTATAFAIAPFVDPTGKVGGLHVQGMW